MPRHNSPRFIHVSLHDNLVLLDLEAYSVILTVVPLVARIQRAVDVHWTLGVEPVVWVGVAVMKADPAGAVGLVGGGVEQLNVLQVPRVWFVNGIAILLARLYKRGSVRESRQEKWQKLDGATHGGQFPGSRTACTGNVAGTDWRRVCGSRR